MSGWEGYIYLLQHKYDKEKKDYTRTNLCEHAAIIGNDGVAWAVSSDWPLLKEYNHSYVDEANQPQQVLINEFNCLVAVSNGSRSPTPAGILMGN